MRPPNLYNMNINNNKSNLRNPDPLNKRNERIKNSLLTSSTCWKWTLCLSLFVLSSDSPTLNPVGRQDCKSCRHCKQCCIQVHWFFDVCDFVCMWYFIIYKQIAMQGKKKRKIQKTHKNLVEKKEEKGKWIEQTKWCNIINCESWKFSIIFSIWIPPKSQMKV